MLKKFDENNKKQVSSDHSKYIINSLFSSDLSLGSSVSKYKYKEINEEVKELDNIIYPKNIKVNVPNNTISIIHKIRNVFRNIKNIASRLSCLYPSSVKKS